MRVQHTHTHTCSPDPTASQTSGPLYIPNKLQHLPLPSKGPGTASSPLQRPVHTHVHTHTHTAPAPSQPCTHSPLRAALPCAPCTPTSACSRHSHCRTFQHSLPCSSPHPPPTKPPLDSLSRARAHTHTHWPTLRCCLSLCCPVLPHFPVPPLPGEASPPCLIAPGLSFLDSEAVHLVQSCPTQDPVPWAPWPGLWGFEASLGALGTWSSWSLSQELLSTQPCPDSGMYGGGAWGWAGGFTPSLHFVRCLPNPLPPWLT